MPPATAEVSPANDQKEAPMRSNRRLTSVARLAVFHEFCALPSEAQNQVCCLIRVLQTSSLHTSTALERTGVCPPRRCAKVLAFPIRPPSARLGHYQPAS